MYISVQYIAQRVYARTEAISFKFSKPPFKKTPLFL